MDKNEKILTAKHQMARAIGAAPDVFDQKENIFIVNKDMIFWLTTFGHSPVMVGSNEMISWCRDKFEKTLPQDIMSATSQYLIDTKLREEYGLCLHSQDVRYLHLNPEMTAKKPKGFTYKLFVGDEINKLGVIKAPFTAPDPGIDAMAFAAFDGDKLASLCCAQIDGPPLWSLFLDTSPEYMGHGLGAYIAKELTLETERRGGLPFYTTWAANIPSTRLALSVGYSPVWMGFYAEKI